MIMELLTTALLHRLAVILANIVVDPGPVTV